MTPNANRKDADASRWTLRLGSMPKPDRVVSFGLDGSPWRGNTLHVPLPPLPEDEAPFWLQVIGDEGDFPPISLQLDEGGVSFPEALEAFQACVQAKDLHPAAPSSGITDDRDRLLTFTFGLASQVVDFWSPECFNGEEQEAILDHLEGDVLFSQPWTLALALRHPGVVLDEVARRWPEPAVLSKQLARLAQAGWTWWVVGPAAWKELAPPIRGRLREALQRRYLDCRRCLHLRDPIDPATRLALVARICEEGFIHCLGSHQRRELMKAMGFPYLFTAFYEHFENRAHAFRTRQVDGVLADWQAEWERFGRLLLPGVAEPDVVDWASQYQDWLLYWQGEPLLRHGRWAAVGPKIFRHFAIPFVGVLG